MIKLWDMNSNDDTPFAAIETPADSAEVTVVPNSGLLFVRGVSSAETFFLFTYSLVSLTITP